MEEKNNAKREEKKPVSKRRMFWKQLQQDALATGEVKLERMKLIQVFQVCGICLPI